jgi:hypothetical protein
MHVDHLAAHAVTAAPHFELVALVLQFGEASDQFALVDAVAAHHVQHHLEVFVRIAEAVDRRHRGHHDGVLAFDQALVAESRICSMCSLIEESFSM